MSMMIAVTGKGGVGKTTISALLARQLIQRGNVPVLAIDADPNSCLDSALGVKAAQTVGRAREEVREQASQGMGTGMSKHEMLSMKIEESLVESQSFDLIAMGRPEGAGCYCYANNVLKSIISELSGRYPYVLLDNEAGLENLSRRIVQRVDVLCLVSDASNAGLSTLVRLYELAGEMCIEYGKLVLIINRIRGDALPDRVADIKAATKADIVLGIPDDAQLAQFAESDRSLLELPDGNQAAGLIDGLLDDIIK